MASLRTRSAAILLLATCCMLHVAAAAGAGLPAWTKSASGAGRARLRRVQAVADEASTPRRKLRQASLPSYNPPAGLSVQVFKPYNSPYTLPIPASAKPSAMTTAPNLNYTAASSGGVMALAGGTMTNFALRFTGYLNIPGYKPANYTFLLDSDDGSLLYIDGNVVISDPGIHGFNGGKSATVLLVPGVHDLKIEYVQATGLAGIVLKYSAAALYPQVCCAADKAVVPPEYFTHLAAGFLSGLNVQTFVPFIDDQSAPYGSPNKLPIPGNATPTASTTTPGVNFPDVSSGGLMALANATTNFALRFVGLINLGYQVTPPRDPYQYGLAIEFTITSDDGSQLILDNQIHIDNSGKHAFQGGSKGDMYNGYVFLGPEAQLLAFEIDYYQATGLAGLVLNYSIIAIKDFAANQQGSYPVGDKGPSTVVPAFWYAHQPLTTPPPPSPPPPPPPPPPPKPPCPVCSDDPYSSTGCCAPKVCVDDLDSGGTACCNKGQQVCGFDQPNRGGSRCCDVCMFTEDGESVCCPAGSSELCDGNTEAYGCCPDGDYCVDADGYTCAPSPPPPHKPPPPKKPPPPPVKH